MLLCPTRSDLNAARPASDEVANFFATAIFCIIGIACGRR
jgi:hypothetical protein